MTIAVLWLAAASIIIGANGYRVPNDSLPFTHRPGVTLVQGPKVSLNQGTYRIMIELPTYDYSEELSAMASYAITSDAAVTQIKGMHGELEAKGNDSSVRDKLVLMFNDLTQSITQTLNEFRKVQEELKELQQITGIKGQDKTEPLRQEGNHNRTSRDLADYMGLASTAEMAEVNRWVTSLQTSETKLAHSEKRMLTYLNRTAKRLNLQEDRLNNLAIIELGWEKVISSLRRQSSTTPQYLDLLMTLVQGISVVNLYTGELRFHMSEDIRKLKMLASGQMPPNLLTVEEYREILREAPKQGNNFLFTQPVEDMVAMLPQIPVKLLRDDQQKRLYAKLFIPIYDPRTAFQLYRFLPVPMHHRDLPGVREVVNLPNPYIAVAQNQYFHLDPHISLFDCEARPRPITNFMDRPHMCVTPQAIITHHSTGNFTSCAATLYYGPNEGALPPQCRTKIQLNAQSLFRHLKSNIWSYDPNMSGILRFICPIEGPPPVTLHPNGGQILIPEGCRGVSVYSQCTCVDVCVSQCLSCCQCVTYTLW